MSLLLKALQQIDSRPLGPATEEAVKHAAAPIAPDAPAAVAATVEADVEPEDFTIPGESASRSTEPISLEALFAIPFEPSDSVTQPAMVAAPTPATVKTESSLESPLLKLEALRVLLAKASDEPPAMAVAEKRGAAGAPRRADRAPLRIRDEYRELCDHLRARFAIEKHATVVFIDAGRVTNDAAWLMPVAAGLLQSLEMPGSRAPTALLVEAAGPDAGIAVQMGIDCPQGLNDALRGEPGAPGWSAAIQPTEHPQIDLLCRGTDTPVAGQGDRLASLWPELKKQYDLLLVAAGPLSPPTADASNAMAELFLPVADAAILCVELDATPQAIAERARHTLDERGVNLLGCVVRGSVVA